MSFVTDSMCVLFLINDASSVATEDQKKQLENQVVTDLNNPAIEVWECVPLIMRIMGENWRPSHRLIIRWHHFFEGLPQQVLDQYPQLVIATVELPEKP